MISYTTFFNQILNQYIAKRQNDPHFFNGRTDQEAMGFMVAVNAFREELAHPTTKKITDKPTIQKIFLLSVVAMRKQKLVNGFMILN